MGLFRFLLAIAVVMTHSDAILGIKLIGGLNAVQTFYIISGFYMTMILNEKYVGAGMYKLFISNRLLRLYPIYWVVLGIGLLTSLIAFKEHHGFYAGLLNPYYKWFIHGSMSWWAFIYLVIVNVTLVGQDWTMFMGLHQSLGTLYLTNNYHLNQPMITDFILIPQAWTLGVEISFYLIAPFLVRMPMKKVLPILGATMLLRAIFHLNGITYDPWSYRFFPLELMYFLLGYVSYQIYVRVRSPKPNPRVLWAVFVGLMIATYVYQFVPKTYYYTIKYIYNLITVLSIPYMFHLTKSWKWDRWIGELSYPVYICHMLFVSAWSVKLFPTIINEGVTVTTYSVLMAIALNYLVANPVERIRQRRVAQLAAMQRTES